MHIFLSPHYDDAALSCGGLIHELVHRGESVLIVTIMGGDPPNPPPDTPIVRDLHRRWQAGDDPVAARRLEDAQAARELGVHTGIFNFPDCVYRVNAEGEALYPSEESLWGDVQLDDPARTALLTGWPLSQVPEVVYCPLGVGDHVDHKLVRDWGATLHQMGMRVLFYEEYPYTVRNPQARNRALTLFQAKLPKAEFRPFLAKLSEDDVSAKVRAIACYQSQISTFWKDINDMEQVTRAAMMAVGSGTFAERYWTITG
jgi:LmbE family N-acetylglucosaminyl deacetylase